MGLLDGLLGNVLGGLLIDNTAWDRAGATWRWNRSSSSRNTSTSARSPNC